MDFKNDCLKNRDLKELALPENFFRRDTVTVAREIPGNILLKKTNGIWSGGPIVEAEAYLGDGDPSCHACRKKTDRNAPMFGPPGQAYVYLIYGMYNCFNTVSFDPETQRAGGVLIRAIEPMFGIDLMQVRRKKKKLKELTTGPGKLCQALEITLKDNGSLLNEGDLLVIRNDNIKKPEIVTGTRIGISVAKELPYRFYIKDNPYVSRLKKD